MIIEVNGREMLIDEDDYNFVKSLNLSIETKGYCQMRKQVNLKRKAYQLHRILMNAPHNMEVDHINGNKLDNRKCNLRIVSHSENCKNMPKFKSNTSGYKGVTFRKDSNNWEAYISNNKRKIYIGTFNCPTVAWFAYVRAARELHEEFARFS